MSLDSLFKQNNKKKTDTDFTDDQVSGEFRSRSEEESIAAAEAPGRSKSTRNNKRSNVAGNSRKNSADELALPEKKRARRRLIGAMALVLAAVIFLPMVFESEPKQTVSKIAIEIPAKDGVQGTIQPASQSPKVALNDTGITSNPDSKQELNSGVQQSVPGIDKTEEVIATPARPSAQVSPPRDDKSVKDGRLVAKVDAIQNSDKNQDRKLDSVATNKIVPTMIPLAANKAVAETVKKPEVKVEPKTDAKKDNIDDAARALALLEGRTLPEPAKVAAKNIKSDNASGNFVVQVAALNSATKVRELQNKLKAANIQSYTQKITTKSGEVSRIRVGPFNTKADAEKMRAKLVKIGLSGSLVPN